MQAQIWLTGYQVEALAKGQSIDANGFSITDPELDMEVSGYRRLCIIEVDVSSIDPEACREKALRNLAEEEARIRGRLESELTNITRRRNELLALPQE